MSTKKDFKLNPPQKKGELTNERMLDYVEKYYEDKLVEFAQIIEDNTYERQNTLEKVDKETVPAYEMKKIRAEFLKMFGDNEEFAAFKKEKKENKKQESTQDRIKRILSGAK